MPQPTKFNTSTRIFSNQKEEQKKKTGEGLIQLVRNVNTLLNLENYNLGSFEPGFLLRLFEAIEENRSINFLALCNTNLGFLSNQLWDRFLELLCKVKNLKVLDLSDNIGLDELSQRYYEVAGILPKTHLEHFYIGIDPIINRMNLSVIDITRFNKDDWDHIIDNLDKVKTSVLRINDESSKQQAENPDLYDPRYQQLIETLPQTSIKKCVAVEGQEIYVVPRIPAAAKNKKGNPVEIYFSKEHFIGATKPYGSDMLPPAPAMYTQQVAVANMTAPTTAATITPATTKLCGCNYGFFKAEDRLSPPPSAARDMGNTGDVHGEDNDQVLDAQAQGLRSASPLSQKLST
jgi:hypothetical protein